MLPKKQTPLVRAETICCTLAAVIVAICLAHHPGTSWPLAVTLALLIAANVLQILRDHKDRKDEDGGAFLLPYKGEIISVCP